MEKVKEKWKEISVWGEVSLICPVCDKHIKLIDVLDRPTEDNYKSFPYCPKCKTRLSRDGYIY